MKKSFGLVWLILVMAWWMTFISAAFVYLPAILDYAGRMVEYHTINADAGAVAFVRLLPLWTLGSALGIGCYGVGRTIKRIGEIFMAKEATNE